MLLVPSIQVVLEFLKQGRRHNRADGKCSQDYLARAVGEKFRDVGSGISKRLFETRFR